MRKRAHACFAANVVTAKGRRATFVIESMDGLIVVHDLTFDKESKHLVLRFNVVEKRLRK